MDGSCIPMIPVCNLVYFVDCRFLSGLRRLILKFPNGTTFSFHVHPRETIAEVKHMIQQELRKPQAPINPPKCHRVKRPVIDYDLLYPTFKLCRKGKCLKDHLTVAEHNIQDGDVLNVVPK